MNFLGRVGSLLGRRRSYSRSAFHLSGSNVVGHIGSARRDFPNNKSVFLSTPPGNAFIARRVDGASGSPNSIQSVRLFSSTGSNNSSGAEVTVGDLRFLSDAMHSLLAALHSVNNAVSRIKLQTPRYTRISFEEFKDELLEPGLVDHIVIVRSLFADVHVKSSKPIKKLKMPYGVVVGKVSDVNRQYNHVCYLHLGMSKSLQEKLQIELERDCHDYIIPVTHVSLLTWIGSAVSEELFVTVFFSILFCLILKGLFSKVQVAGAKAEESVS